MDPKNAVIVIKDRILKGGKQKPHKLGKNECHISVDGVLTGASDAKTIVIDLPKDLTPLCSQRIVLTAVLAMNCARLKISAIQSVYGDISGYMVPTLLQNVDTLTPELTKLAKPY